jgi:hypothetical protein
MIWMTWRQLRVPAAVVFGALALAVLALAITGPQLAELARTAGPDFYDRLSADRVKMAVFNGGTILVYAVPALIGVFWGAPLVAREVESGTHRLIWSQSITRTRWMATKLGLIALAAVVASGLISLALTWWTAPIDDAIANSPSDPDLPSASRLLPHLFGARGVVPIGMTVLALAIGVTAGLLIRRTVAAMAVTLAAVVAVQIAAPLLLQPHLLPPERMTTSITPKNLAGLTVDGGPGQELTAVLGLEVGLDSPGAWITENVTLEPDGSVADTLPKWVEGCADIPGRDPAVVTACFARLAEEGYRQRVEYQPASRFWPLQWAETGILLGVAGLLAGFCFWRVRRDLT